MSPFQCDFWATIWSQEVKKVFLDSLEVFLKELWKIFHFCKIRQKVRWFSKVSLLYFSANIFQVNFGKNDVKIANNDFLYPPSKFWLNQLFNMIYGLKDAPPHLWSCFTTKIYISFVLFPKTEKNTFFWLFFGDFCEFHTPPQIFSQTL